MSFCGMVLLAKEHSSVAWKKMSSVSCRTCSDALIPPVPYSDTECLKELFVLIFVGGVFFLLCHDCTWLDMEKADDVFRLSANVL